MDNIKFLVQGSKPQPYEVVFKIEGKNLTGRCSCPAGLYGQHCKHRLNILMGITEGIVSDNKNSVKTVQSWLRGTDVEAALKDVCETNLAFESAKKKLSLSKKKLDKSLMD